MDRIFDIACLHPENEYFTTADHEYGEFGVLSQPDSCPSLSSSFLSIDTFQLGFDNRRRLSIDANSSDDYISSSGSATSPMTPLGMMPPNTLYGGNSWPRVDASNMWTAECADPATFWLTSEESAMDSIVNGFTQGEPATQINSGYFFPGRPKSAVDPPLSRAVFQNIIPSQTHHSVDEVVSWLPPGLNQYPQTVEPSATFRSMLPSSPLKYEPVTPMREQRGSSSFFSSSPLSAGCSSAVLPSQWEMDESRYLSSPSFEECGEEAQVPPRTQTRTKSHYGCTAQQSPSSGDVAGNKSGLNCDAIIPQNTYACGIAGCVDKDGRPKRFKRQEHRKRHERTVHEPDTGSSYKCWVVTGNKICGRKFSRRDNLKSHWKKTHGRKSNNQRNAYVATLDEDSKYYDENWTGPLTADGLPVGHPKWPELRCGL